MILKVAQKQLRVHPPSERNVQEFYQFMTNGKKEIEGKERKNECLPLYKPDDRCRAT